jgi:hypothetical protein
MFPLGMILSSVISFQVDDDVKRHNDLLEVIKRDPSQIKALVARRRKDFTEEFFVHVRDMAQSYYENPGERDGMKCIAFKCALFSLGLYRGQPNPGYIILVKSTDLSYVCNKFWHSFG